VKKSHLGLGIAISVGLMVILFARTDYDYTGLWTSLVAADIDYVLLAGALTVATVAMRAWRWRYLLRPLKAVGFASAMSATSIGLMANMILPLRLGEIARAMVLAHRERLDGSAALATIVIDRLLDGFTILFIFGVLLLVSPLPLDPRWQRVVRWTGPSVLAVYVAALAFLLYLSYATDRVLRGLQRAEAVLPRSWVRRLMQFLTSFSSGLQSLGQRRYRLRILATSLLLWGAVGVYNFAVVQAFQLHLPLAVGFLLLVFQAFAVMVPASPGFVGTHHAASVACLLLWGVPPEAALTSALVMHAINYFLTIALGLGYLWSVGLSLRALTRPQAGLQRSPSSSA
jgi:uncharacterized protein (TIRG00374 family)